MARTAILNPSLRCVVPHVHDAAVELLQAADELESFSYLDPGWRGKQVHGIISELVLDTLTLDASRARRPFVQQTPHLFFYITIQDPRAAV